MKHEDAEEGDDHDGEDDVGEVEERLAPQHHVERDVRRHGLRGRAQVPEAQFNRFVEISTDFSTEFLMFL